KNDYDIILMDVQMPEMDGHSATRKIRSEFKEPKASIPILAFTAYATTGEAEKCLEAGMDDYISKPVDTDILINKLVKLLKASPAFPKAQMQLPFEKNNAKNVHINLDYFNTVTEDDNELRIKMLRIMIDETPGEIAKLIQNYLEQNWDGVRAMAHKMKSTLQFIGLADTLQTVKQIEANARELQNLDTIGEKIKKVEADAHSALLQLKSELERISL
ncbi:MAG: response regulator, partial [Chitinophagales bacterium]